MTTIFVSNLKKYYQVFKKEPGVIGSFKSLFFRHYEIVKAVDDISFEIKEGELVGFIGPNGAGKTTTLKCLSGLLYPTSGKVNVLGFIPQKRESNFLRQISLVMGQKNQLWWDLPAIETFLLNKEIYGIKDNEFKETLEELVNLLEIKDLIKIPVRKLSLGERMKCELIAALIHKPKVLFLDEPTIGLDIFMQKKIRDFIRLYNQKYKATIILTSHYMSDVKELCQRVIIIDKGKVIYDGSLLRVIEKYATKKRLEIILSKEVEIKKLEKIGEVNFYQYPKVIIFVPRNQSNFAAAELLANFPVLDLNIEEENIEDIIRKFLTKEKDL